MNSSESGVLEWKPKKTSTIIKQRLENNEVILVNNYRIIRKIGQGRFGKVKLCERLGENSTKNRQFAMKIFSKRDLLRKKDYRSIEENGITKMKVVTAIDRVQDEINLMSSLYHRNVVLLFESLECDKSDKIYLVMEFMENGPCMKYDPDGKTFTSPLTEGCLDEFRARNHIKDIVNGVLYLHSNKICHRDLKTDNILLNREGRCHISDFGCAQAYTSPTPQVSDTVGTYQFLAPECCMGGCYNPFFADIWAIGIIMYVLLFGKLPFVSENATDLFEEICGVEVQLPLKVSSNCEDLLLQLLKKDQTQRIKISNVLQHPWMCEE